MKEKLNFETDDFVKNIVEDPAKPQGTIFLQGFLGDSDKEDHVRLYYDPGLNYYADIKKEDVVHLQKITKTKHPLGGVMLWVKHGAGSQHAGHAGQAGHDCKCSKEENMAAGQQYFQGNVYNQYLGQQQAWQQYPQQGQQQGAAGFGAAWPTAAWLCPPTKKCK